MSPDGNNTASVIDYDLHGIVGIRLLDAPPAGASTVARLVGPARARLARDPDIVIRFVDRLPAESPLRYLGKDALYSNGDFLLAGANGRAGSRVQISFDMIGSRQCEVICERGVSAIPMLIPILNLTMLAKGFVPLHASAFVYNGTGVLATGWAKGGKTETVLAFMANGAEYVGDEWIYISADGQRMYGLPAPIRVWDWHLDELPAFQSVVRPASRLRWWTARHLAQITGRVMGAGVARAGYAGRVLAQTHSLAQDQRSTYLAPQTLFGNDATIFAGTLDTLLFVVSHESPEFSVRPIATDEIAQRMVFSLGFEHLHFLSRYLAFRFAFPEQSNEFVECAGQVARDAMTRALAGKDAYAVYHPYPVSLPALFAAAYSVV